MNYGLRGYSAAYWLIISFLLHQAGSFPRQDGQEMLKYLPEEGSPASLTPSSLPLENKRQARESSRKPKHRHSTRVYNLKPAPFLLPPFEFNALQQHIPSYSDTNHSEPIVETTKAPTTTTEVEQPTTPPPEESPPLIDAPSLLLTPPKVSEQSSYNYYATEDYSPPTTTTQRPRTRYRGSVRFQGTLPPTERPEERPADRVVEIPEERPVERPVERRRRPYHVRKSQRYRQRTTTTSPPPIDYDTTSYSEPEFVSTTDTPLVELTTTPWEYTEYSTPQSFPQPQPQVEPQIQISKNVTVGDEMGRNLLASEVAELGMKVVTTNKGKEMMEMLDTMHTHRSYQDGNRYDTPQRNWQLSAAETGDYRRQPTTPVPPSEPVNRSRDYSTGNNPTPTSRRVCSTRQGYVADVASGCQVFYICLGRGVGEPMICPNGTLFSQDFLVCDWWYNVECRRDY